MWWMLTSLPPLIVFFGGIFFTLPRFKGMYNEMIPGEPLPVLTTAFFAIPPAAYAVMMLAAIAAVVLGNLSIKSQRICGIINLVVALGSVIGIIVYGTAIFLPLTGTLALGQ
jgi:hypothetical protein